MNSAGVTTSMSLTMIIASSIPWPPESPKEEEEDDNREESTLEPYPALVPTVGMILSVVGGSKVVNEELCNAGIKAIRSKILNVGGDRKLRLSSNAAVEIESAALCRSMFSR